ncbi:hypothetical protein U9M48_030813 [Paspalum notatum var. saurae]|uniref:Uncharacterized protein n=1 Tax=Paspalum notatum var. saurae TaxID=547442 RepID=A0AAQ3U4D8_PASNO
MEWELTEVLGNPTPSVQDSTVDVVAAKIEAKEANTLISFQAVEPGMPFGESEACKACTSTYWM